MAPNDLLKHEIIEWADGQGLVAYVLGGGYQRGDGIFRYKRGFNPDGVVPFHGLRLIGSPEIYGQLSAASTGANPSTFFPAYRAP
jgi:hypothetical protein